MAELMYIIGTILILPAIIFGLYAQTKVMGAFNKYSKVASAKGVTGAQLARRLLDENGCNHVTLEQTRGRLSDHYDPRGRVIRLSPDVYSSTSLAALGIAAHEVGHAIQHQQKYAPLMVRQLVIKSTGFLNKFLLPLIIIGVIASIFTTGMTILGFPAEDFWFFLIIAFAVLYGVSFLISVITLPTEFNASNRAKDLLQRGNYLYDNREYNAVSSVLGAAALTYVAAFVVSMAYFLRFFGLALMMVGRRR